MILADGCFDPMHWGHVQYLQAAAAVNLHETLVVNIAPDEAIRAKGREPFQTAIERANMISAFRCVGETWIGTLPEVIRARRPRWVVKGPEWTGRLPREVEQACAEVGATIVYTDTDGKRSSERLAACLTLTR